MCWAKAGLGLSAGSEEGVGACSQAVTYCVAGGGCAAFRARFASCFVFEDIVIVPWSFEIEMRPQARWLAGAFPIKESSRRWSGVGWGTSLDLFIFNALGCERFLIIHVNQHGGPLGRHRGG